MRLRYLLVSENKEVLKDLLKEHRSQFEQAPASQTWDTLSIKIIIAINYNPLTELGIHESILILIYKYINSKFDKGQQHGF